MEPQVFGKARMTIYMRSMTMAGGWELKLESESAIHISHLSHLSDLMMNDDILILDRASHLYASASRPTFEDVLDEACSQYRSSGTHDAVKEQFSRSLYQCSTLQFTEFVLSHRQWLLFVFRYSSFCPICMFGFTSINKSSYDKHGDRDFLNRFDRLPGLHAE